jgi:hypothetical protein
VNPPATSAELATLERELGGPLPSDLRLVATRFNGGQIPSGSLVPVGIEPGTIGACVREYAQRVGRDFLDPELLLPFHRTVEGSLLAFDRSAGPVSDTWPIVDYDEETGEHRLVYRTFDGFCRACVAEWTSEDFGVEFDLDTYLRKGQRHATLEPDVATSHATVAHAQKRAGRPDEALASYLEAARCVPPLPWCDWEALKLAAVLGRNAAALEAATRLATLAPPEVWSKRETTPGRVAEVIAPLAARAPDKTPWLRLLGLLGRQAARDPAEARIVAALHEALDRAAPLPAPRPARAEPVVPANADVEVLWQHAYRAYAEGYLREDDLLFDRALAPLGDARRELLKIRRDF